MDSNFYNKDPLISVEQLHKKINSSQLMIFDASLGEIPQVKIPGAQLFDFDHMICDRTNPLPHMMPTANEFEIEMQKLGVNSDTHIVVYDGKGIFSSPRVYFMLKAMGHNKISILNGGLPAWLARQLPVEPNNETKKNSPQKGNWKAHPHQPAFFCNKETVLAHLNDPQTTILDARSQERFLGKAPEPRQGLRAGHIPNSQNLPFSNILKEGHFCSLEEIKPHFEKIPQTQKLIFSCGSGVTACIIAFAAEQLGYPHIQIYDGSWAEWGQPGPLPIEA